MSAELPSHISSRFLCDSSFLAVVRKNPRRMSMGGEFNRKYNSHPLRHFEVFEKHSQNPARNLAVVGYEAS